MEIPKDSEVGLKFAAMSEAICDVLASVATMFSFFAKFSRRRTSFQTRNAKPRLKLLSGA